ncbi:twin transmembrane helix small protein [Henriciella marina]|uniref:twin transmembrane helix small protein n=1 Tax=Henriciella marina TaxID=453851 RepID=UPI00037943A1|nr:twin transmembrane helix small protein [Henriciella marina]
MTNILMVAFYITIAALVVVLVLGITNLARSDNGQASRSNKLMRLRVLVQAIAIALLCAVALAAGVFS